MTESKDTDRKKLSLSKGRLSLGRSIETGQVKQSFSHGRSKTVQVERRRKRTVIPGAIGDQGDGAAGGGEAQPRALTAEERAARTRALQEGLKQQETTRADEVTAAEAEAEAARIEEQVEPAPEPEPEIDRRQAELEEARRIVEEEDARKAEEAQRLSEAEAARQAAAAAEKAAADRTEARRTATEAQAQPAPAPSNAEDEGGPRGRRRGGGDQPRRTTTPGGRRGDQRRRSGKLTISQALDDGGERVRSLASVRRAREREKARLRGEDGSQAKQVREVIIPDVITVQELSNRMAERGVDVVRALMKMGVMATINDNLDTETAELITQEFGHRPKRVSESDVEIGLEIESSYEDDVMTSRAPVVTVMGHVDHGKTSLLDALRKTDVAAGEAGGITQHIGAYQITMESGQKITFLDTPGHEAFTEMRARGANVTDIVVLVVAADDGIMAQTVEAIRHAKAAECPIIVAVNKIDRPNADPQRVRTELLQHEIVVEEMGGDVLAVDVSALEGTGLDKLEEAILLQSEVMELKASADRRAEGQIVEAKVERGRGSVATVLMRHGTLRVGDVFVAGAEWGRVRAIIDDHGRQIKEAGPSMPVEVLGLNGTPVAGDDFVAVESEARAREITEYRSRVIRERHVQAGARGTVEQMLSAIAQGKAEELPLVIKTDVHGSFEAIRTALMKMSNNQVSVRLLHGAVGAISESDVSLAGASNALILGFNVRANRQARDMAAQEGVEVRYYSIIYDLINDVKAALTGMLSPDLKEEFLGNAEIRDVFNITKVGKVAGCMVTEGTIRRGAKVRLLRDNVVIHEGSLKTLKRFKDEVREVREGYECGAAFENYHDIQVGDFIECFEVKEVARTLESVQSAEASS